MNLDFTKQSTIYRSGEQLALTLPQPNKTLPAVSSPPPQLFFVSASLSLPTQVATIPTTRSSKCSFVDYTPAITIHHTV